MPATSITSNALEKVWTSIYGESQKAGGYHSVRVFVQPKFSMFGGQHQPRGLIVISLEAFPKSIKKISLSQEGKRFEVVVRKTFNATNSKVCRVSITLNNNSFPDLFKGLATDIVGHCLSTATEADAITKLNSRLDHWRRFSAKAGDEGLFVRDQTELFGELLFLRTLVDQGVDDVQALKAWRDPLRDNQNFHFGLTALKVEVSASNSANRMSIFNVRQLDDKGMKKLFFYHVSLDRRNGSSESLSSARVNLLSRFKKPRVNVKACLKIF